VTQAALDINQQARVDGLPSALAVLALIALIGLFVARRVPTTPSSRRQTQHRAPPDPRPGRTRRLPPTAGDRCARQ